MVRTVLFSCAVWLLASIAGAQVAPGAPAPPPAEAPPANQPFNSKQGKWEQVEPGHQRFTGRVDFDLGGGVKLFADLIEYYTDSNRLVASGNVVFTNPEGRLSAEQVEFNLTDQRGTFHQASGIMSLGVRANRAQFGGQEPDVYFYGETIEKVGNRQYRVSHGGFTTCVQPTPRWEIVSGSVVLNLDDYAIAKNMVLQVKGVPLFYLPLIYYPIQSDQRATGFLLPTYGASTVRGQSLSNAFFWAIDRSQDATFFHDWFTRTGQGYGSEYRYVAGPRSLGNFRIYRFDTNATTYSNGSQLSSGNLFQITSAVTQLVGPVLRAQVNIDYFSNVFQQQLYQQNVFQSTQSQRRISAGLSGATGPLSAGVYYLRSESFGSPTSSTVYGTTPRATAALAPQSLFGTPIYAGANAEYSFMPNKGIANGETTSDTSLGRFSFSPTVRAPLSKLTFLSVNTTEGLHTTIYSRRLDPAGQLVPEAVTRQYFSSTTEAIGPVFTKIWDTPDSTTIQRMKHVIEPNFSVEYITDFANQAAVPRVPVDPSDYVVGGSSRLTYGLTNRLFYRARDVEGVRGTTREFVTVGLQQTYYTNPLSSQFDPTYVTGQSSPARALSPIALTARISPSATIDSNTRVEYDVNGAGLQSLTTGSTISAGGTSTNISFSRQHPTPTTPVNSYLGASTSLTGKQVRGTYAVNWDISHAYVVSQRITASYMAQCCGLQVEYQNYHYPANSGYPVTADRRINFGFVLAGLGTFSNFFGAFGGVR
jgi:LPS-assembly protein